MWHQLGPLANTSWSSLSNCLLRPQTSPVNVFTFTFTFKCKVLLPVNALSGNEILVFVSIA